LLFAGTAKADDLFDPFDLLKAGDLSINFGSKVNEK
jgi:hypothetical protein